MRLSWTHEPITLRFGLRSLYAKSIRATDPMRRRIATRSNRQVPYFPPHGKKYIFPSFQENPVGNRADGENLE